MKILYLCISIKGFCPRAVMDRRLLSSSVFRHDSITVCSRDSGIHFKINENVSFVAYDTEWEDTSLVHYSRTHSFVSTIGMVLENAFQRLCPPFFFRML